MSYTSFFKNTLPTGLVSHVLPLNPSARPWLPEGESSKNLGPEVNV